MNNDKLVVGFSCIGHALVHLVMILYPTVVLALEHAWAMPYGELISLSLPGFLLFGAGALPAGWLGDKWSAERMMLIFFVGTGLACIFTGMVDGPVGMAVGLGLIGLFGSIYHPVGVAWIVRVAVNRGRLLGLNGIFGSAGLAAGPFVAGALSDIVSWRAAFIVPGILFIVFGIAMGVMLRSGTMIPRKEDRVREPLPARGDIIRVFVVLSVTMACAGLVFQGLTIALPKVFAEHTPAITSGMTIGAGALVGAVYVISAFGHVIGGWAADRYPSKPVYIIGWALQVPLLALCATTDNWMLFAIVTVASFVNVAVTPAETLILVKYTPEKYRATAFGAKFVLALGVAAISVPMVAVIYQATGGFWWFFMSLAAFGTIIALASALLPSERRRAALHAGSAQASPAAAE
ncbi:MAG: MFS transporter [Alphaproteobacteria bacterium]